MRFWVLLMGLSICGTGLAHGPTPQKTDEVITLSATPEAVWKKVMEPCGMAKWHPEISGCEAVNDKQQMLTLKNGKKILHEIDEISSTDMTLSYRFSGDIDIEALPVSSLNGKIKVLANSDGAKVSWTARYYRAFTGNEPPTGQDDEAAKNAIDQFVKSGLSGLKDSKTSGKLGKSKVAESSGCCQAVKNLLKKWGLNF